VPNGLECKLYTRETVSASTRGEQFGGRQLTMSRINVSEPREYLNRSSRLLYCSCRIWGTMLSKICITGHRCGVCHAMVYVGTTQSLRRDWLRGRDGPKLRNIKISCESLPNGLPSSERILGSRSVLWDPGITSLLIIGLGPIVETLGVPEILPTPLVSRGSTKH
jgi:hypothetical protein